MPEKGNCSNNLCVVRGTLTAGGAEEHLLDALLALCQEQKLLGAQSRQRTDSTYVLGAVHSLKSS
jgi:hypothetical protein